MLVADMFAMYSSLAGLCFFFLTFFLYSRLPLVCLTPAIRAHIPGQAISDLGAKAGSEGLKCWDCSPCTTRLFSASYAARHFQTVPHSSELNSPTGCICICQHVHRDIDIILQSACTGMWWGHYGFAFLTKLWCINTGGGSLLLFQGVGEF